MSIIRINKREHPYAQVDKRVLDDRRLSWRSKGILVYLLAKPDGWTVRVQDIWSKGKEGRNAVQACLDELQKHGYAQLVSVKGAGNTFVGKEWQVNEEPIGGFLDTTERPKTNAPKARKSVNRGVNSNNKDSLKENQSNNEGVNTPPPAENFNNLEEEKNKMGLVPPPPAEAAAPGCPACTAGITHKAGEGCAPTHMVTEILPADPTIRVVSPFTMPTRVDTTIEAEKRISEWIAGEGLETVKFRYETAKERFDPSQAPAIAAHYCSVFTKNQANKERLLKDPVTHFSDGLFSYLKSEQQYSRQRPAPGPAAHQHATSPVPQNIRRL